MEFSVETAKFLGALPLPLSIPLSVFGAMFCLARLAFEYAKHLGTECRDERRELYAKLEAITQLVDAVDDLSDRIEKLRDK